MQSGLFFGRRGLVDEEGREVLRGDLGDLVVLHGRRLSLQGADLVPQGHVDGWCGERGVFERGEAQSVESHAVGEVGGSHS